MRVNILAVGDVVGEGGLRMLSRHLRTLRRLHQVDFAVVNGENASGWASPPSRPRRSWMPGRM